MRRSVTSWMAVAVVLVCVVPAGGQPLFTPAQDPLAGSRVFGVKGCARCHAIKGIGGKVGPDLGRGERPRSFYDLAAELWNHAPRMAERMRQLGIARPKLDERESADLVAFLFTVDYFDVPGDLERGRRVLADKRCLVCHQVGGVGGVVGPSLDTASEHETPISLAAAMWNHSPQMAAVMREKKIPRPVFTGAELRDLIAYVNSASAGVREESLYVLPGNADEGRRLFADKQCAECHSAGGTGGKLGPDLAQRRARGTVIDFAAAMWNKAPAMLEAMKALRIPVPELRPAEMADIVAYLYSVRYLGGAGDPRKGLAVATAKGCLACHSVRGEGGAVAPDLRRGRGAETAAGALAALWNHSFIGEVQPPRGRAPWSEMTAAEMADLIAFLQSGRRSP